MDVFHLLFGESMGQVRLISDVWDYIAVVELREGIDEDPEQNALVYRGPVKGGQEFVSAEDVTQSYRRSSDPDDPTSPLSEWDSTSNPNSGVEDWHLN
jgi:hypothetical protein